MKNKGFLLPAKLRLAIAHIGIAGVFLRSASKQGRQNGLGLFSSTINVEVFGHHVCVTLLLCRRRKSPVEVRTDALCNSARGMLLQRSWYVSGFSNSATRVEFLKKVSGPVICLLRKLLDHPSVAQQQQAVRFLFEEVGVFCGKLEFCGNACFCCMFSGRFSAEGQSNLPRA